MRSCVIGVQRMKEKSRLVVLHDTEHEELSSSLDGYRYRYRLHDVA